MYLQKGIVKLKKTYGFKSAFVYIWAHVDVNLPVYIKKDDEGQSFLPHLV